MTREIDLGDAEPSKEKIRRDKLLARSKEFLAAKVEALEARVKKLKAEVREAKAEVREAKDEADFHRQRWIEGHSSREPSTEQNMIVQAAIGWSTPSSVRLTDGVADDMHVRTIRGTVFARTYQHREALEIGLRVPLVEIGRAGVEWNRDMIVSMLKAGVSMQGNADLGMSPPRRGQAWP